MIALLAALLIAPIDHFPRGESVRNFAVSAASDGYQVAWSDGRLLTAHVDANGNVSNEIVLASQEIVDDIDVASNGVITIVVWREGDALRIARLDREGRMLDQRTVSRDVWHESFIAVRDAIAIAAGEHEFLLIWAAADKSLIGTRLTFDGASLDEVPLRISRARELWDTNPDIVFANGRYYVVWSHYWVFAYDLLASEVRSALVSTGGEISEEHRLITAGSLAYTTALLPSIAANKDAIVFAYVSFGQPRIATLDEALGTEVRSVPYGGTASRTRIVWNGTEWLAVVDSTLLAGDSFRTIATFDAQKSAIASGGDGRALIVYETSEELRAAFVQPTGPRRRTVRH